MLIRAPAAQVYLLHLVHLWNRRDSVRALSGLQVRCLWDLHLVGFVLHEGSRVVPFNTTPEWIAQSRRAFPWTGGRTRYRRPADASHTGLSGLDG